MSEQDRLKKLHHDFVTFKEETLKLIKSAGGLIEATELNLAAANEKDIIEVSCLKDIEGMSFFTLGPVYVLAQVPYSFLDQFAGEVNGDVQFLTFDTSVDFMNGLDVEQNSQVVGTWNNKIHAIPTEHLDVLTEFMTGQVLTRDRKVFGLAYQDAMIQDPVLKQRTGVKPENLMRLRIFTAYTNRGMISPYIDIRSGQVRFCVKPVAPDLVRRLTVVRKVTAEQK